MKFLIAGLGNIGTDYQHTRHNIGFDVVDYWVEQLDGHFEPGRLADVSRLKFRGKQIVVIKPSTYMNLSGKAVTYWMQQEKIDMKRLLVVTDDLALPLGTIRLRTKGSAGGHNGLKDIIAQTGTEQFSRIKFGIGAEFPKGRQVDFVLSQWDESELTSVREGIELCKEMISSFIIKGAEQTMNDFNKSKK